jgi:hypothetical protein
VRPAGGLGNAAIDVEPLEATIPIGLQHTPEGRQMRVWVLGAAVWAVAIMHSRRRVAGKWPLVAEIGPQTACLGLAGAWRQHGNGCIIRDRRP